MAYFSAIERDQVLTHTTKSINLENSMLRHGSQAEKAPIVRLHLYKINRVGKSIETEQKLVVARACKEKTQGAVA